MTALSSVAPWLVSISLAVIAVGLSSYQSSQWSYQSSQIHDVIAQLKEEARARDHVFIGLQGRVAALEKATLSGSAAKSVGHPRDAGEQAAEADAHETGAITEVKAKDAEMPRLLAAGPGPADQSIISYHAMGDSPCLEGYTTAAYMDLVAACGQTCEQPTAVPRGLPDCNAKGTESCTCPGGIEGMLKNDWMISGGSDVVQCGRGSGWRMFYVGKTIIIPGTVKGSAYGDRLCAKLDETKCPVHIGEELFSQAKSQTDLSTQAIVQILKVNPGCFSAARSRDGNSLTAAMILFSGGETTHVEQLVTIDSLIACRQGIETAISVGYSDIAELLASRATACASDIGRKGYDALILSATMNFEDGSAKANEVIFSSLEVPEESLAKYMHKAMEVRNLHFVEWLVDSHPSIVKEYDKAHPHAITDLVSSLSADSANKEAFRRGLGLLTLLLSENFPVPPELLKGTTRCSTPQEALETGMVCRLEMNKYPEEVYPIIGWGATRQSFLAAASSKDLTEALPYDESLALFLYISTFPDAIFNSQTVGGSGFTVLMELLANKKFEMAAYVLNLYSSYRGGDLAVTDTSGRNALMLAAEGGSDATVKMISSAISRADPDADTGFQMHVNSLLIYAALVVSMGLLLLVPHFVAGGPQKEAHTQMATFSDFQVLMVKNLGGSAEFIVKLIITLLINSMVLYGYSLASDVWVAGGGFWETVLVFRTSWNMRSSTALAAVALSGFGFAIFMPLDVYRTYAGRRALARALSRTDASALAGSVEYELSNQSEVLCEQANEAGGGSSDKEYTPSNIYQDPSTNFLDCVRTFFLMTLFVYFFVDNVSVDCAATPLSRTFWILSVLLQLYISHKTQTDLSGLSRSGMVSSLVRWVFCLQDVSMQDQLELWSAMFAGKPLLQGDAPAISMTTMEAACRMMMSYASNGLYLSILVYTLPIFMAQSERRVDFLLNSFAVLFIVDLDNKDGCTSFRIK